jgi:hypothetical protein
MSCKESISLSFSFNDEALTSPEVLGKIIPILSDKISESITDSINSSIEASIKALMDEHIIPLKQTLKEQQKQIDEQKEMIGMILPRTSGLVSASITCTVIVFFALEFFWY